MDIERLKQARKEKKLSYDDLAKMTGYSRSTITNIFCGYIELPRHETIVAIETALGLTATQEQPLSIEEKQLVSLISELTDEEVNELSNYVDYIISKREK